MKDFISYVGEKYDREMESLRNDIQKNQPNQEKYIRLYIYKTGKLLDDFMWNDYERYVSKYIDKEKYNNPAMLKQNFVEGVQVSGYTIGGEPEDRYKIEWEKYSKDSAKRVNELSDKFKKELLEFYEVSKLNNIDAIYDICVDAAKDGGFYFIEKHLVRVLDVFGIRKDTNPEIIDEVK